MHDGMNAKDGNPTVGVETERLLRAMRRRDQSLMLFPLLVILVLAAGLILSDRSFWDSRLSFREGSADELGFLTLNLILYTVFRHRQVRKIYDRLTAETIRSETLALRLDDLKSILKVSSSVRSADSLGATLQVIVDNARNCLQGDFASLHLRSHETNVLDTGAVSVEEGLEVEVGPVPVGHGVAGVVSYTGRPVILSDREEVASRAVGSEAIRTMSTVLAVPLMSESQQFGTLTIGKLDDTAPFSLADLQLLIIFADYAGHVIESSQLDDERAQLEDRLEQTNDALQRAQRHMSKSEKLPTIERMVSRLGHDLANPLTSILGYSQLMQKMSLESKPAEYAAHIFGQTRRCQEIVEGFLSYVRGNGSGRFICNLNEIIEQSLELERDRFDSLGIQVRPGFDPEVAGITGNSFLLQEAVLHLIHNSEEAMQDSDRERYIEVTTSRQGARAFVDVRDNGPGVPIDCEARIFEPFFSTRENPNSNGLGLTLASRIIEEHGGTLRYHGNGGAGGAHFRIDLPIEAVTPMPADQSMPRRDSEIPASIESRLGGNPVGQSTKLPAGQLGDHGPA